MWRVNVGSRVLGKIETIAMASSRLTACIRVMSAMQLACCFPASCWFDFHVRFFPHFRMFLSWQNKGHVTTISSQFKNSWLTIRSLAGIWFCLFQNRVSWNDIQRVFVNPSGWIYPKIVVIIRPAIVGLFPKCTSQFPSIRKMTWGPSNLKKPSTLPVAGRNRSIRQTHWTIAFAEASPWVCYRCFLQKAQIYCWIFVGGNPHETKPRVFFKNT